MADPQALVAPTYTALAEFLDDAPDETWDAASLCEGWQVRNVVAHMTMPVRLTPAQFGAEMAAADGDFGTLSNSVAARDGQLPARVHLQAFRSPELHAWQPPRGGADGALNHAVIHSLDITIPLGRAPVASPDAVRAVLDNLVAANGAIFGIDLDGIRLEADDLEADDLESDGADWSWGAGTILRAPAGHLVALLGGRTLPDGRALPRATS